MAAEGPVIDGVAQDMLAKPGTTSEFLRAISHPARLVILWRLAEGAANVTDPVDFTGLPQAEASKQLARLRAAGLVTAAREGRARSYALCQARTARILRVLHAEFCGPGDNKPA